MLEPPAERDDQVGVGALLRTEDRRALLPRRRHVAEHGEGRMDVAPPEQSLDRPPAAVDGGRAAGRDQHPAHASLQRRRDQDPGATGRGHPRIQLARTEPMQATRRGDVHRRQLAASEDREIGLDRATERILGRDRDPRSAVDGEQDVGRPFTTIGQRAEIGEGARPQAAAPDRLGDRRRGKGALEGIGRDQNPGGGLHRYPP